MYSSKSATCSPGAVFVPRLRLDELERFRRDLVGVDLVAEQEHGVGPFDLAPLKLLCVRPECVDPDSLHVLGPLHRPSWVGCGSPMRQEPKTRRALALVVAGVDDRLRASVVGRPDEPAVETDLVRRDGVRGEVVDEQQRVVVTFDRERRRAVAEDLDLARRARLDPERRALGTRVAQHGAEHELGRAALARAGHR